MTISIDQISVAPFKAGLKSLDNMLDKAKTLVDTKKLDPNALLLARLAPDMFHLLRQVQAVTDQARNVARLAGLEPPKYDNTETTFDELKARIAKSIAFLDTVTPEKTQGAEDRSIDVPMGPQTMQMKGIDYVQRLLVPNYFFHLTAAYMILRHNGLEIGKRDFLGMR
ncbi:MAG: DUF1993 domain-containing protein [Proteobacteria bacterium]|jgi:hypothetical protein|nr:DUF1993 domain-containing protein [Pseudomonadota bacterium]